MSPMDGSHVCAAATSTREFCDRVWLNVLTYFVLLNIYVTQCILVFCIVVCVCVCIWLILLISFVLLYIQGFFLSTYIYHTYVHCVYVTCTTYEKAAIVGFITLRSKMRHPRWHRMNIRMYVYICTYISLKHTSWCMHTFLDTYSCVCVCVCVCGL
jgi:hypothetical protein